MCVCACLPSAICCVSFKSHRECVRYDFLFFYFLSQSPCFWPIFPTSSASFLTPETQLRWSITDWPVWTVYILPNYNMIAASYIWLFFWNIPSFVWYKTEQSLNEIVKSDVPYKRERKRKVKLMIQLMIRINGRTSFSCKATLYLMMER